MTHSVALPALRLIMELPQFPYTMQQLETMPAGTLGNELAMFLRGHRLHLLKDYESHDLKHLLLGYGPDEKGEVCLQYFMLGNRQYSFPVLATVLVGAALLPEFYRSFINAYRRGRRTPPLADVNWFALVPQKIATIKQQLSIS